MNAAASEELVESETQETRMTYHPGSVVPFYVVGVWACALIGLGAYFLIYYITDLQIWGMP